MIFMIFIFIFILHTYIFFRQEHAVLVDEIPRTAAWQTRRVAPAPTNAAGTNNESAFVRALVKPLVNPCGKLDE